MISSSMAWHFPKRRFLARGKMPIGQFLTETSPVRFGRFWEGRCFWKLINGADFKGGTLESRVSESARVMGTAAENPRWVTRFSNHKDRTSCHWQSRTNHLCILTRLHSVPYYLFFGLKMYFCATIKSTLHGKLLLLLSILQFLCVKQLYYFEAGACDDR